MNEKSWGKVIAQIEQSGLDLQKKYSKQRKQRYDFLQKDLVEQMKQIKKRKQQQLSFKQVQRTLSQSADKSSLQEQIKYKQKLRQKQQKLRQQNFQLLQEKLNMDRRNSIKNIKQVESPFTMKLLNNSSQKQKKAKQMIRQCNQINIDLMNEKVYTRTKQRYQNNKKGEEFKNHVQQTFLKIQSDRYKLKKSCLKNGYINKTQRIFTEPDSLQKQHSLYLQQQIDEKIDRNYYRNRSQVKNDDRIENQNIQKINHDLDKQTSSPAYLGRIPSNYDRQKQLNYLNKQLFGNRRFETQSQHKSQQLQANQLKQFLPTLKIQSPQIIKNNYQKLEQRKPIQIKNFRQFNILTGKMIVNEQPIYFS